MIPTGDETVKLERSFTNVIIILLNITVYILMVFRPDILLPGAESFDEIIERLGAIPIFLVNGEKLWTVFTSMFIHAGLVHLLGNMLYLYIFGDNVEAAMGRIRYLAFYLLCGIGAILFHIVSISLLPADRLLNRGLETVNPWAIPAVGASGAISGVLGAYLVLYPAGMIRAVTFIYWFPIMLKLPAFVFIIIWFLYQLVMGLVSLTAVTTGIAFWAHIGGFITGVALLPLFVSKGRLRKLRFFAHRLYYGL